MMRKGFLKNVRTKLIDFVHLQLFLTLISWPILIAWGLPLSWMSPVGNFIFGPVMTLFLFVSTLIFFSELLFIPNGFLIGLLDRITQWWIFIMHYSSPGWLVGTPASSRVALAVLPFCALAIIYFKPWAVFYKNILALSLCGLLTAGCCSFMNSRSPKTFAIPGARKAKMQGYAAQKTALVIGTTGLKTTALDDFIDYTLLSELIKMTGRAYIDFLIITQPVSTAFQLAENLCKRKLIGCLYVSKGEKKSDVKTYQAYQALCAVVQLQHIKMRYIESDKNVSLDLGRQVQLEIQNSMVDLKS